MDLQAAYAIAYNFPGALYILGRASWVSVRSHCAVLWLAIAAALTIVSLSRWSALIAYTVAYTVGLHCYGQINSALRRTARRCAHRWMDCHSTRGQVRECYVAMISRGTTQMRCSLAHSIAVVAALLGSPACRNVWMAHTRSATCLAAHVSGTLLNAPLHGHWLIARLWSTIANLRRAGPEISTDELLPIFSSLLWDSNVEIAEAAAYEIHRSRPSWN